MSSAPQRLNAWSDLTLADLVFAYRKAKADCFYERAVPLSRQFAEYEQALEENLCSLLARLRADDRAEIARDESLLGVTQLVAKKLRVEAQESHAYFSSKGRAFDRLRRSGKITAEFRFASRLPVDLHIIGALWVNRVGHRFDACLSRHAYGSRLRRYGEAAPAGGNEYHLRAVGSMAPYFLPYQRWREDGLAAIERSLRASEKIIALTLDIRNFYHRIDPRFISDRRFHAAIDLGKDDEQKMESQRTGLTEAEKELTSLLAELLTRWSERAVREIRPDNAAPPRRKRERLIGGLPICVTACRLMANVLLCEWDRRIMESLAPIHYGRYVDDIFLVLRDPGNIDGPGELMDLIANRLPGRTLKRTPRSEEEHSIHLGPYQGETELLLQDNKHKVFFLEGQAGLDLLRVIRGEMAALSSERRLMPDPEALTTSPAARVLTAAGDARESVDTLRRAEGLSIRRMGWAIQLRNAETLALDLPPEAWSEPRAEFYRFARDHVLRPECLMDHLDYLPRLLGLAVSSRDWGDAISLYEAARGALEEIRGASSELLINGYSTAGANAVSMWDEAFASLGHAVLEAVVRAWPWASGPGGRPETPTPESLELLQRLGIDAAEIQGDAERVAESDLARTPLKDLQREHGIFGGSQAAALAEIESVFDEDPSVRPDVIRDFLASTRERRLPDSGLDVAASEGLLPFLFPTRPFTPREIAELDPRCVDLGDETLGPARATEHWGTQVRALRGIWTRIDTRESAAASDAGDRPRVRLVFAGLAGDDGPTQHPRLGVANLKILGAWWHAAADGKPALTRQRYRQVGRLVNAALRAEPRPHYLLLPELALPRRWVASVANRLLQSRISLVSGVEYEIRGRSTVRNDAVLALTDDRLGFNSSVLIWQHKSAAAPGEEESLLRLHGKALWSPSARMPPIVYHHQGFEFGVLICSELQDIRLREVFRGEVDGLLILSWNKDLETFSALVESAALDVHAYVAFVNNRLYGDSRVRSPSKESHQRDLCRIRGGLDDHVVVVGIDVEALRRFQSRHKNWPREDDPFKPTPQGFRIAPRRYRTPGGETDSEA